MEQYYGINMTKMAASYITYNVIKRLEYAIKWMGAVLDVDICREV